MYIIADFYQPELNYLNYSVLSYSTVIFIYFDSLIHWILTEELYENIYDIFFHPIPGGLRHKTPGPPLGLVVHQLLEMETWPGRLTSFQKDQRILDFWSPADRNCPFSPLEALA